MLPGYTIFLASRLVSVTYALLIFPGHASFIIILTVIQFSMSKIENRSGLNAS